MENLRAFEVTYKGPTNTRGSRVILKDLRFDVIKVIPFSYEKNDIGEMANDYLKLKGIDILFCSEGKKGYILTTRNFTNQIN